MQTDGRTALLAVLATLVAITVATNTTASLAQPQIGAAFDAGPADTAWVVFGYSATFALGTALWGGIASRTGIIPALVAGVAMLGIGSAAAAAAPTLELVIGHGSSRDSVRVRSRPCRRHSSPAGSTVRIGRVRSA